MAKIAVYDKFFHSQKYPDVDIARHALADSGHKIIGSATHIREAANQIIGFANRDAEAQPDLVIMGGKLDGDDAYRRYPAAITEPCTVRRSTWWGGVREVKGKRLTFLLPQFEDDGLTYHFPSIVAVGKVPEDAPEELLEKWSGGFDGVSALILSRIVETYLPDAGRLGISRDLMFDASLSLPGVERYKPGAVQQLQRQIQELTTPSGP